MTNQKHYLRPLTGKPRPGRHLLLWIDADETQPVLKCTGCRAWDVVWHGRELNVRSAGSWRGIDDLDALLDQCCQGKGTVTIWTARGWEDLVLSGLAQLLDANICTWRYAMLDGQRVLVRGQYRHKSIIISSLANWTGKRWSDWDKVLADTECQRVLTGFDHAPGIEGNPPTGKERLYLAVWSAIAMTAQAVGCTSLPPTVAAASLQMWRRWLGPRIKVEIGQRTRRGDKNGVREVKIVAPSPFRPERVAAAERHCCYGLTVRQLRRGLVDETIYCLDLRSAYALALASTPLPLAYRRPLFDPSAGELAAKMADGTALALVRIKTNDWTYPARRGQRVRPMLGHYWTWLCGTELAHALCSGHVAQIKQAYLWHGARIDVKSAEVLMGLAEGLTARGWCGIASVWRTVYSALVGQFAGKTKVWRDLPPRDGIERWCQWTRADLKTGNVQTCRSIAGKQQTLTELTDATASVPMLFACVTSQVRWCVQYLLNLAGRENTVAIVADSLWLTTSGWQSLQRALSADGGAPDQLHTKSIFDRAWLTGKSSCVVERKGVRYLVSPGVPDSTALDPSGRCSQVAAVPWCQQPTIDPASGVQRRLRRFAGDKIMRQYGGAAEVIPLGEVTDDPLLPAELLERVKLFRSVADD